MTNHSSTRFKGRAPFFTTAFDLQVSSHDRIHDRSNSPTIFPGFTSASTMLVTKKSLIIHNENEDCEKVVTGERSDTTLVTWSPTRRVSLSPHQGATRSRDILLNLKVKGTNYNLQWKELVRTLKFQDKAVSFRRERNNDFDTNAIQAVLTACSTKIGYIAKEQARYLAPLLDEGLISFQDEAVVFRVFKTVLGVTVKASTNLTKESLACRLEEDIFDPTIQVRKLLRDCVFAQRDLIASKCSPYTLSLSNSGSVPLLLWDGAIKREESWKGRTSFPKSTATPEKEDYSNLEFGWGCQTGVPDLSTAERMDQKSWPPSDDCFAKFGMGSSTDKLWWREIAGMKPPCEWDVNAGYDLLASDTFRLENQSDDEKTRAALAGTIHGVTNVWLEESLEEIRELIHSDRFWLNRKGESFVRGFGSPYVLGQRKDDLTLLLSSPHDTVTSQIARAHNLVYTAVHLEFPASPGFNTIVFGLSLAASGFHYHQDSMAGLKPKNAPMLDRQPVVTTVFYEKPESDSGKECVFWKPLVNFTPRVSSTESPCPTRSEDLYIAARAVPTLHGVMHVQMSGLQSRAMHGVFTRPAPKGEQLGPREGYRVSITARIAHRNALDRMEPYLDVYKGCLGPSGNHTLPKKHSEQFST